MLRANLMYFDVDAPVRGLSMADQQLIEIEFTERDGATTVVFVNSNISNERRRDSQYDGWSACIDNMERALAA